MKRLAVAIYIVLVWLSVPALAEKPNIAIRPAPTTGAMFTMGELKPTPEMWFYEQYLRQSQDPKVAVRANAEYRAAQRQLRINAMKWYGMSNQRPQAGVDPLHSDYSPVWSGGSANYPFRWAAPSATIVLNPR